MTSCSMLLLLLADPHFDSAWDTAPLSNATLHFEQCDNSSFLQARFRLCGSLNGLSARVASISLDVWYPKDSQSSFFIVPRNEQDMKAFGRRQRKLHILLKDADDVAEWAVPTVRPSWWGKRDKTHQVPWQCNFPSDLAHLTRSDRALCMYLKRGCPCRVNSISQDGGWFSMDLPIPLGLDPATTVRMSEFLLCARESKEPPKWALSEIGASAKKTSSTLQIYSARGGAATVRWESRLHGLLENLGRRAPQQQRQLSQRVVRC